MQQLGASLFAPLNLEIGRVGQF